VLRLPAEEPLAVAVVDAIRAGDEAALRRLLAENSDLATARVLETCKGGTVIARSLLHIAADWPGHFPHAAESVKALIESGADVNARMEGGSHTETPLHGAASSDDIDVLDALLDAGADIEAPGAVIAGGTALADAVAFGQWRAARRLIERGARTNLWQASGLGLFDRVAEYFAADPPPDPAEVTKAFWLACHGGQTATAEYLLGRGADINWIGYDNLTPLDAATRSEAPETVDWLSQRHAKSAKEISTSRRQPTEA
jgi:hypothetical protein